MKMKMPHDTTSTSTTTDIHIECVVPATLPLLLGHFSFLALPCLAWVRSESVRGDGSKKSGDGCCRPFIAIVKLLSVCLWLSHWVCVCASMSAWVAFYETSKCQSMSLNDFYITPNTMTRPLPGWLPACQPAWLPGVSFWVYLKDSKIRQLYCCCYFCCCCCSGARPTVD